MDAIEIPKNVRAFASMADALAELVKLADKHNALIRFETEHADRIAKLRAQEQTALDRIASANADAEKVRADAKSLTELAKQDAIAIRAEAVAEAERVAKAASDLTVEANQAAEAAGKRKAEALDGVAKAEAHLAAIQKDLAAAKAVIAKAEAVQRVMG